MLKLHSFYLWRSWAQTHTPSGSDSTTWRVVCRRGTRSTADFVARQTAISSAHKIVCISMLISRRRAWYSVFCKSQASTFCATTAISEWKIISASGLPGLVPLYASWSTISHAKCTMYQNGCRGANGRWGQERPDQTKFQAKLQSNEMLQHQSQSESRCPKQGQDFCHHRNPQPSLRTKWWKALDTSKNRMALLRPKTSQTEPNVRMECDPYRTCWPGKPHNCPGKRDNSSLSII